MKEFVPLNKREKWFKRGYTTEDVSECLKQFKRKLDCREEALREELKGIVRGIKLDLLECIGEVEEK